MSVDIGTVRARLSELPTAVVTVRERETMDAERGWYKRFDLLVGGYPFATFKTLEEINFYCHARTDIPALCDALEAAEARVAALERVSLMARNWIMMHANQNSERDSDPDLDLVDRLDAALGDLATQVKEEGKKDGV
ncbi:MAG: hypothetical protein LC793_18525 [Thermomicrobia bacterium]|nr:hypothetical protein [Thermomicrobia bacterium]